MQILNYIGWQNNLPYCILIFKNHYIRFLVWDFQVPRSVKRSWWLSQIIRLFVAWGRSEKNSVIKIKDGNIILPIFHILWHYCLCLGQTENLFLLCSLRWQIEFKLHFPWLMAFPPNTFGAKLHHFGSYLGWNNSESLGKCTLLFWFK